MRPPNPYLVFPLLVLALTACQSPPGSSGSSDPGFSGIPPVNSQLPPQQAQHAVQLYLNKCARCHRFYDPRRYTEEQWQVWMHKMSRKAKLQPDEEELLARYLEGFRSGPSPPLK
jgi:hypothetical protein